jgi:hypothetical protein
MDESRATNLLGWLRPSRMTERRTIVKYMCLGYLDEKKFESMTEAERDAFLDACFAYDEVLRAKGHFLSGEGLESSRTATTVRVKNGKPLVTDGPFIETREQVGGVLILEAKDVNEAIQLISNHPGIAAAGFEIRPIADMSAALQASEKRRRAAAKA